MIICINIDIKTAGELERLTKALAPFLVDVSPATKPTDTAPESLCPLHQVQMRQFSKNGKVWLSHKTIDGWCNGK
jgi:hypothetical protein